MGKATWVLFFAAMGWLIFASIGHLYAGAIATGGLAPVPSEAGQIRAEREIKDVFKDDYAKPNPVDRHNLAQKLINQGKKTNNDLPAKFVLFREARDVAAGAGDYNLAFKTVDELAAVFAVDATDMKSVALVTAAPMAQNDEENLAVGRAALGLSDAGMAEDNYQVPARLLPVADSAARKAQRVELLEDVRIKTKEFQERQQDFDQRKTASAILSRNPSDPDANSVMGRSLCFNKGAWDAGLLMLAKGSDVPLKNLALKELAPPATGAARLQLADAWWDLADHQADPAKATLTKHANEWYVKAWPELSEAERARAESHLSVDAKQKLVGMPLNKTGVGGSTTVAHRVVDLMPMIDLNRVGIIGQWKVSKAGLESDDSPFARLPIGYDPPDEYDFRIEFTRLHEDEDVVQLLSHGKRNFVWQMAGWKNTIDAFGLIGGKKGDNNSTTIHISAALTTGKRYTSVVQVRRGSIAAYIDNKLISKLETDFSNLSMSTVWKMEPDMTLGVGSNRSSTIFHKIELVEITGTGKPLPLSTSVVKVPVAVSPSAQVTIDGYHSINLLPLINAGTDTIAGKSQLANGKWAVESTEKEKAILRLPYIPADDEEYDFHFGFFWHSPSIHVVGLASHGAARFDAMIGSTDFGVENIKGKDYLSNGTLKKLTLAAGVHHDGVIRVRRTRFQVCDDGRILVERNTSDATDNEAWKLADKALGLGVEGGHVEFDQVEVIEVRGAGNLLRYATPVPGPSASLAAGADSHRTNPGLVAGFTTVSHIETAEVAPKGDRLALYTSGLNGAHFIIDVSAGELVKPRTGGFARLLPDAKRVLAIESNSLKILDFQTAKDLMTIGPDPKGSVMVASNGTRLLAIGQEHLLLYDLSAGKQIGEIRDLDTHVPRAFSPAGEVFAAGAVDGQLHVWNAGTGKEMWQVPDERTALLQFSADGKRLLRVPYETGSGLELFNSETGEVFAKWGGWDGQCVDAAMSANGKYLAVALNGNDAGLRLFTLDSKAHAVRVKLVDGWPSGASGIGAVNALVFSPSSDRVLTACQDGKVRLFDIKGKLLAAFDHGGEPLQVNFSSDGHHAVSWNDATVRVWKLP